MKDDLLHKLSGRATALSTAQLKQASKYAWNDGDWQLFSQAKYDYDEIGRVAKWFYLHNGVEVAPWHVLKTTHGPGYEEMLREVYDPPVWIPDVRTKIYYVDGTGNGVSLVNWSLNQLWHGSEWVDSERFTYLYRSLEISGGQTEVRDGDSWIPTSRFTVEQVGADVVIVDKYRIGNDWVNARRITFRNWNVKALQERLTQVESELNDFDQTMYCIYLLPTTEVAGWDGAQWYPAWRQIYEYDDHTGDVLASITESWTGTGWLSTEKYSYTYKDHGLVGSISKNIYRDETWSQFGLETYVRDKNGSITELTQQWAGVGVLENAWKFVLEWKHTGTATKDGEFPDAYALEAAYPNPFYPTTSLTYRLASSGHVGVHVYDTLGRLAATIVEAFHHAGRYEVIFDGANLPSGPYIVRIEAGGFSAYQMITLIK